MGIAIDGSGNAWVYENGASVSELTSGGTGLVGASCGNRRRHRRPSDPAFIAIDGSGNVWAAEFRQQQRHRACRGGDARGDTDGGQPDRARMARTR